MDKLISKSLIEAAEKIADAQVQAEFLAPAARDGFVKTFLAELDDECLLDAEEHTALALKVVQAQARVAKLSPERAAQQFLLAYQQSARHEKLGTGFPEAPAVPVEQSLQDDHLICLEDGKKVKLLKRHLRTYYGMTPNDYRKKWGLPADYPMVPRSLKLRNSLRDKLDLPQQTDLQPQDN